MTGPEIGRGCIIHWEQYTFADGETADKFLVILGAKKGCNYLAVKATSRPHRRRFDPGRNEKQGYFHLPAKKEWFPKDTWLLLAEPEELIPGELLKASFERQAKIVGALRPDIANAVCNCLKRCDDISELHIALL